MAFKPIYLEPDEEITSVIDKISSSTSQEIVLVTAKNSSIFQSLVNLKLLAKESKKSGKNLVIVTGSKIGQRLAKQVGITTYGALSALPIPAESSPESSATPEPAIPDEVIGGVQVKQYDPNRVDKKTVEDDKELEQELSKNDKVLDQGQKQELKPITVNPDNLKKADKTEDIKKEPENAKKEESKEELPAVVSGSGEFSIKKEFKIPWKSVGIGTGIFLFVMLLAFIFVPRAVVTVTFPALPISETVSISAITQLENQQDGQIAGNQLIVEKTKTETINATGKKDIGTAATGSITIVNKYTDGSGLGKDQSFSAGSKATDNKTKKVFTLNNAVTVGKVTYDPNNGQPIYKSKTVGVTAVEPGEGYNVAATSFTIVGELANTPITSSTTFAGGLTKQVTVITQDDIDTVILKLKKESKEEALAELIEKAQGQKILEDGIWETVKQVGSDKKVGTQADTAVATVITEYGVIVFDEVIANSIFTAVFDNKINENEQIVFPEGNKPVFKTKKISDDKRRMDFEISGTAFKVPKIDKKLISKSITNKSSQGAQQILQEKYGAESVESVITPNWWIDRLPFIKQAIRIEYGFSDLINKEEEAQREPKQ